MKYAREDIHEAYKLAFEIMMKIYNMDRSGKLLYLFMKQLSGISKLKGFGINKEYRTIVITEDEYSKLKSDT